MSKSLSEIVFQAVAEGKNPVDVINTPARKPRYYHSLRQAIRTSGISYGKPDSGFSVSVNGGYADIRVEKGRVVIEGADAVYVLAQLFWHY